MRKIRTCGSYYGTPGLRYIALSVKRNELSSVLEAAAMMAVLIPEGAALVPIPSCSGRAEATLSLALAIGGITKSPVADILKGEPRVSWYKLKKEGCPPERSGIEFRLEGIVPFGRRPVLLDNVIATGTTVEEARRIFPEALAVALAEDDTAVYRRS